MKTCNLLAFDLGASNGRGVMGAFDGERITLTELHRFENNFVRLGDTLYWNALGLYEQMKRAFAEVEKHGGASCFGVDTWGVDFGLIDQNGALLGNPRCYRNAVDEDMETVWKKLPREALFARTGIASMNFNTVYQLYRRRREGDPTLNVARAMLLMPDLLGYFFTGEAASEYTNVTTTMLYDPIKKDWAWDVIEALGLPKHIFTRVDHAGTLRGMMLKGVASELGVSPVPLAAVGTHDTASAVAAIPGQGSFAFCSSGTWSLFGVETDTPVLTDAVYKANFSNEGTVQGGFRPLKNIMGLWLIQECRRDWIRAGEQLGWGDIVRLAEKETPFRSIIDADDAPFFAAGNMVEKIQTYCRNTAQPIPETKGQIARCVYESLALKYRAALETLETMKGARIDTLNIVGGGIQNKLLNQMAADATGRTVITGPIEGACAGNLLMQAVALGELSGLDEAREVVKRSFETEVYEPHTTQAWQDAYGRLQGYLQKNA